MCLPFARLRGWALILFLSFIACLPGGGKIPLGGSLPTAELTLANREPNVAPSPTEPTPFTQPKPGFTATPSFPPSILVVTPPATAISPAEGEGILRIAWSGGDFPAFDPIYAWDPFSIQVIESTTVGLLRQDERSARLQFALAKSVETSADGLTYTVHLRPNLPWVVYDPEQGEVVEVLDCEGEPRQVTAYDFEYGLLRLLRTPTIAGHREFLMHHIEGAKPYALRQTFRKNRVGVKALDESRLQLRFTKGGYAPLGIAGLWFVRPAPVWQLEGEVCASEERNLPPGSLPAYGAYVLKNWQPGESLTLIKNPFWIGNQHTPPATIEQIQWLALPAGAKLAAFTAGRVDVAPIQPDELAGLRQYPSLVERLMPVAHPAGTEFYLFNTRLPPTDDRRVRRALSLTIDRDALAAYASDGSIPAVHFLPPGVGAVAATGGTGYDAGVSRYDPELARELLNQYLNSKGLTASQLTLTLAVPSGETHHKRAQIIQAGWQQELGITIQLASPGMDQFQSGTHAKREHITFAAWSPPYPDAGGYLWDAFGPAGVFAAPAGMSWYGKISPQAASQ
ncbi:MAG: ABC transporter substrate-binding protein, partial [Anaerolineaceae bacterium]|nr:ABC transporter substrate-binding protein [Anaerolineaceae bacterium]